MSSYGSNPYGQNPYGPPNPYAAPAPYGAQPGQPFGQPQPYQQPQPGPYGQPGYGQPAPWTAPPVSRPARVERPIPVVTMEWIPGRNITEVIGDVVGVVARSRELPRELRTGPAEDGYAAMLTGSRLDAVAKLVEMATGAGADAVVGLRFDSSEITQTLSEVVAYGTAVRLAPEAAGEAEEPPPAPETTPEPGPDQPSGASWPPPDWGNRG